MYTDSMEQLRGTAGARQVRVRAETALAAFTTPSSGGWIHVRQIPELTAGDTGDHRLAAIILSRVQCYWSKSNAWYRVRRSADTAPPCKNRSKAAPDFGRNRQVISAEIGA
jgi:hypothetical protein